MLYTGSKKPKEIEISDEETANLTRLGLINEQIKYSQNSGSSDYDNGQWKWDIYDEGSGEYYMTSFGHEFIKACKR